MSAAAKRQDCLVAADLMRIAEGRGYGGVKPYGLYKYKTPW